MKAHQGHTKEFDELNFKEQAQSINAQFANLGKAVKAHLRKAKVEGRDMERVREKCMSQADKLVHRIQGKARQEVGKV